MVPEGFERDLDTASDCVLARFRAPCMCQVPTGKEMPEPIQAIAHPGA